MKMSKPFFPLWYIVMIGSAAAAEPEEESLHEVRAIVQQERVDGEDRTEAAAMIKIGARVQPFSPIFLGAALYTAFPFRHTEGELLGPEGEGGAVLGEAWIRLDQPHWNLTAGRMKLEWPFLNSNDTALLPNLFEAVTLQVRVNDAWSFTAGHARQMAGWENGEDPYTFSDISRALTASMPGFFSSPFAPSHTPVTLAGLTFTSEEDEVQLWCGNVRDIMNQEYVEYTHSFGPSEIGLQLLGQQLSGALKDYHAVVSEIGLNHTIVGVRGSWELPDIPLILSAAYNHTWANTHEQIESSPDLCYGSGDVLFTSGYYETAHSRHGARGYKIGLSTIEASALGVAVNYTHLIEHSVHFDETSLVLAKRFADVAMEGRLIRLSNGNDPDSLQLRVSASYPF